MGNAQSSNVATAVANVANYVNESTTANSAQVNDTSSNVNFNHCSVILRGDFNIDEKADLAVTNNQISKAMQNADLTNNIQQQMMQEAASKVGFLGIGYANASNSASELTNATNSIVQDMTTSSTQFNITRLNVSCDDSFISGNNLNINLSSTANFLSQQTLDQSQTAKIVNDVSQSIKQKATATVEGITGILIAIILCVAVLIYSTGKVASSPGAKVAIGVGLSFLMAIVLAGMYLAKAPPLFEESQQCIMNSKVGKDANDTAQCINQKTGVVALAQPPLRYNYGLLPSNTSTPGGNLLQMSIAALSNAMQGGAGKGSGDNGGYRIDVMLGLQTKIDSYAPAAKIAGVSFNIPNPLMNPAGAQGTYYVIPIQYRQVQGSTGDYESGKCTPGILQPKANSPDTPTDCTGSCDPKSLTTGTDPTQGIANLNLSAWEDYINGTGAYPLSGAPAETSDMRKAFARFVLMNIASGSAVDMHLYIHDYELIQFLDTNNELVITRAKDAPDKGYRFTPDNPPNDWSNGLTAGGSISGPVGNWDTRSFKFQKFMRYFGIWVILLIFLFALYRLRKQPVAGGSGSGRKP